MVETPMDATGLRELLRGWPRAVVRDALERALPDSDRDLAPVLAHWLTESSGDAEQPPFSTEQCSRFWEALQASRQ